ncbi:uncharacterized protein LOC107014784 [Solanum pennellii]|uniref:Uncharacterized protein LOC107014784 n=1 Tax=Solanum pennellii TaxID=28526 RepID=A0ABM1V685_SOLPN|nr:uncharacterized protein LOC107014784 [Solanum pennellii]
MRFFWQFFRLNKCIYDYLVKRGMRETADIFAREVGDGNPIDVGAFLTKWWNLLYDKVISNQFSQDPFAEVARTMYNLVHQVPDAVPALSSDSVTPVSSPTMTESSEAGSSTGSCSGMQPTP